LAPHLREFPNQQFGRTTEKVNSSEVVLSQNLGMFKYSPQSDQD
jgi:hypothetical protein